MRYPLLPFPSRPADQSRSWNAVEGLESLRKNPKVPQRRLSVAQGLASWVGFESTMSPVRDGWKSGIFSRPLRD